MRKHSCKLVCKVEEADNTIFEKTPRVKWQRATNETNTRATNGKIIFMYKDLDDQYWHDVEKIYLRPPITDRCVTKRTCGNTNQTSNVCRYSYDCSHTLIPCHDVQRGRYTCTVNDIFRVDVYFFGKFILHVVRPKII